MFSAISQQSSSPAVNPFATAASTTAKSNPFGFGSASDPNKFARDRQPSPFGTSSDHAAAGQTTSNPFANTNPASGAAQHGKETDGKPNPFARNNAFSTPAPTFGSGGPAPANPPRPAFTAAAGSVDFNAHDTTRSNDPHAKKVYEQLRKDNIRPPSWPSQPGDPSKKGEVAKFREQYETYRSKVRASLTKAGLIDDPDKRKTLDNAIDFKGICEDMCPQFEQITRINESDVVGPEKDPDSTWPVPSRMVKKLARSAAGQEAPLPMDVRSIPALKRTFDYLINDLLRDDANLPGLHGFLWDRTRAIRRDFTFFSSLTPEELQAQVYVLENTARFHVTSLHLLSKDGAAPEDFVEQQELEQLGKSLLSLRDVYDDCNEQGIICENEPEFRAYYLIFHAKDPNIIETLQRQWRPALWRDSDIVRTAVSLVEAMQDTTDFHGPSLGQNKEGPSMAASSAYQAYFRIVADPKISYTMACFAECHFPHLRRSILSSVKKAFARPKDTSKDMTAAVLNRFLQFDTVEQAIDFAELHSLQWLPDPEQPADASRKYLVLNNRQPLPHLRLLHQFSHKLVEKKRGSHTLPTILHKSVYEQSAGRKQFTQQQNGSNFGFKTTKPEAPRSPNPSPNNFPATVPSSSQSGLPGQHNQAQPVTSIQADGSPFSSSPFQSPIISNPFSSNTNSTAAVAPTDTATSTSVSETPKFAFVSKPDIDTTTPKPASSLFAHSQTTEEQKEAPKSPFAGLGSAASASSSPFAQGKQVSSQSASSAPIPTKPQQTPNPSFNFSPSDTQTTSTATAEAGSTSIFAGGTLLKPSASNASSDSPRQSSANLSATATQTGTVAPAGSPKPPATYQSTKSVAPQKESSASSIHLAPAGEPNALEASPAKTSSVVTTSTPPSDFLGDFTRWYLLGDGGLFEEFKAYVIENLLGDLYDNFHREQEEQLRKEQEERLVAEADAFRQYNLALRYFYRWKTAAREKRLRTIRLEAREEARVFYEKQRAAEKQARRQAAARAARAEAEAAGLNRPEELMSLLKNKRVGRREAERALLDSGVLSGVGNEQAAVAEIVRREISPSVDGSIDGRRSRSGSVASSVNRGGSKTRALRNELLGGGSAGFRRSLPPMSASARSSAEPESSSRKSRVSERWRLKAMGITQMPDGTALPENLANEILYGKKQHDDDYHFGTARGRSSRRSSLSNSSKLHDSLAMPPPRSTPAMREPIDAGSPSKRKRSEEDEESVQEPRASAHKRIMSGAEQVISELRALRMEMEEGSAWFREQNERLQGDTRSRGTTPWDESI